MKSLLFATALSALLLVPVASAQMSVSPTRVIVDMRSRSTLVTVLNTSDDVLEIDAETGFKLIRTDAEGNQTLDTIPVGAEQERSCREWIRIFPRRFTLQPGGSRPIRLMVEPSATATDGEYWGRLIVSGTPVSRRMLVAGDTTQGISTRLAMRLVLDLPVIFRRGEVDASVTIDSARLTRTENGNAILADLSRHGNAAYRGTLYATVRDASGTVVAEVADQFTAEFSLRKRLELPNLPAGTYQLTLVARAEKKGTAADAVLPAEPVERSWQLVAGPDGPRLR